METWTIFSQAFLLGALQYDHDREVAKGHVGLYPYRDHSLIHWTPTERTRDEDVSFLIMLLHYE